MEGSQLAVVCKTTSNVPEGEGTGVTLRSETQVV